MRKRRKNHQKNQKMETATKQKVRESVKERVRNKMKLKYEGDYIQRVIKQNKWDIIGIVETNQRGKNKGKKQSGYKTWISNRDANGKQGGGISIYTHVSYC